MPATMRQQGDTNTQRYSAHAAIFAKQLACIDLHPGNGCTQPLPLTRTTELQTQTTKDP